jgi:hypothetical protein
MRIAISIILLAVGAYVFAFWMSGSHGHVRLYPISLQHWIPMVVSFICFGIPVFYFIQWIIKKAIKKVK